MKVSDTSQVQSSGVEEQQAISHVTPPEAFDSEQVSSAGQEQNSVEQWSGPSMEQVGSAAQGLLPVLGSLAEKIFGGGGMDANALQSGTMAALGGVAGGDGALIAFGLKALTTLLQCQSPEQFIQAGIKLATDPNFPLVCEKLFEVASNLAAAAA